MSNRLFTSIAILVMGFLLFAFSLVQKNNAAVLNRVSDQQAQILSIHQQGHQQAGPASTVPSAQKFSGTTGSDANVNALLAKISALETRIATLESDAKPIIDQVKAQQAAYEQQRKDMEEAMKKVYDIEIGNSPVRGNPKAPVTLVEFIDFQCSFCSRFHSVSTELLKAYPDKVKYVLKNFPLDFHKEAKPAVKAVFAAKEQGKYWEMVDAILEDNSALSADKFQELAKKIGLNVDKFNKDLKSKDADYEKIIEADIAQAGKVGVRGTPAFYLNGRMAQPEMGMLKKAVDEALKK